jgi:hypothetical protein
MYEVHRLFKHLQIQATVTPYSVHTYDFEGSHGGEISMVFFWVMTPCGLVDGCQLFQPTCWLDILP